MMFCGDTGSAMGSKCSVLSSFAESKKLSNFRHISLRIVKGKISFGILAKCLQSFLYGNGYLDDSVQKVALSGCPGLSEPVTSLFQVIEDAKKIKEKAHRLL